MKTTLEIPDDLFRKSKALASLRGESLKDLVVEALQMHLAYLRRGESEVHEPVVRWPTATSPARHALKDLGWLGTSPLDGDLLTRLERRAARHGRTADAEHREILRQALAADPEPSFDTLAAELRQLTRARKQTPSEILLAEGRDERSGR